jgi:hypothetical protein
MDQHQSLLELRRHPINDKMPDTDRIAFDGKARSLLASWHGCFVLITGAVMSRKS